MIAWGLNWFILLLWLGLTVIGLWKNALLYKGGGAVLGMFWGLSLLTESVYVGFIMIVINLFVLFITMFRS